MSVRKRKWTDKSGRVQEAWMIHIKHTHPDGREQVIRKTSPVQTRRGAEQYERELREALLAGSLRKGDDEAREQEQPKQDEDSPREASSVSEFVEVFLDEYSRTEGLRPRYISLQRTALHMHILPVVGDEQLGEVGSKHFGLVKRAMLKKNPDLSAKTVNNVLSVLSRMVRFWWERQGLDAPAFNAGLLKCDEVEAKVYEAEVYEQLVAGARSVGPEELAIVLLMGDAGLRQGELRGLHIADLRFDPPVIRVQRALSREGEEHSPKGRRNRTVPMTARLCEALREYLRVRPRCDRPQVFVHGRGETLTQSCVRARVARSERAAGLPVGGRSHVLRHTFVTELGEGDVPAHVIQELVGHKDLKTTSRYLHVRERQAHAAIHTLERRHAAGLPEHSGRRAGAHTEHMKQPAIAKRLPRGSSEAD
jgi:integrase